MNRTTPYGKRFTGWFKDDVTPAMKLFINGVLVLTGAGNDLTLAGDISVTGTTLISGVPTIGAAYTLPIVKGTATNQIGTNGAGVGAWAGA